MIRRCNKKLVKILKKKVFYINSVVKIYFTKS